MTVQAAAAAYFPSELAYAHVGGARIAMPPPRWPARILFIESRSAPGFPLRSHELHGIEVLGFSDAIGALLAIPTEQPSAVVAPTDMVHVDFLSFVEGMVAWTEIPVIVGLAAHDGAAELAYEAISAGARSIIGLPCRSDQLGAAVRTFTGRGDVSQAPLQIGSLTLDPQAYSAAVGGVPLSFTPREFLLMRHLLQASPSVVRAEELASALATYDDGSVAATRVLILKVRKKLDAAVPGAGRLIETVRSIGYRIVEEPER